jgi:hypothetical protein
MTSNTGGEILKKDIKNCPFIGIKGEPDSFFGYASLSNFCFRASPPESVKLSHQEKFCLKGSFRECEVYFSSGLEPLPASIKSSPKTRKSIFSHELLRFGLPSLVGLGVIIIFLFLIFRRPRYGDESAIPSTSTSSALTASITSSPSLAPPSSQQAEGDDDFVLGLLQENTPAPTQAPENTPEPTGTFTPTATFTPDFTPGPGLETPFGPENAYILHAVLEGESYPKLADIYNTTVEVIKVSNFIPEGIGLRTGLVIVLIPGVKDHQNLPVFNLRLIDKSTSIEDIAREYQISSEDIIYYNQVNPDKDLPIGRYLIIPLK